MLRWFHVINLHVNHRPSTAEKKTLINIRYIWEFDFFGVFLSSSASRQMNRKGEGKGEREKRRAGLQIGQYMSNRLNIKKKRKKSTTLNTDMDADSDGHVREGDQCTNQERKSNWRITVRNERSRKRKREKEMKIQGLQEYSEKSEQEKDSQNEEKDEWVNIERERSNGDAKMKRWEKERVQFLVYWMSFTWIFTESLSLTHSLFFISGLNECKTSVGLSSVFSNCCTVFTDMF